MNTFTKTDTIAAISTPLGVGGVGVIRISGADSQAIAGKIFTLSLNEAKPPIYEPDRVYHGWIHENLTPVDEAIILCFKAPRSYTGEDVFEIQCHGGIAVVRKILKLCLSNGARLAEAGEFSKRAFMNGKLDLSKAEAVLDIIHAGTERLCQESALNLSGRLAKKIGELRKELIDLLSLITAGLDFPDEVDEPEYPLIAEKIRHLTGEIDNILNGAASSNLMRDGIKMVIAGRPNAGKSSLFNALLDMPRAIVTEIPGTTRDIIQETIDMEGVPVTLIDTAGLRDVQKNSSSDRIEAMGINLTRETLETADVVIYVFDSSQGMDEEDNNTLESLCKRKKVIVVASKSDIAKDKSFENRIKVSSTAKIGLEQLKNAMQEAVFSKNTTENEFFTNTRQQESLKNSKSALLKALESCEATAPQDLMSIDLKTALICLGEITGEVVSEEIIDNIFSNFCIGK